MTAYPWYLEKTSKKYRCPSCKAEKRFKRYVFAHNNEYIHDLVGRCDRENSCGYHYSPKEYFACSGIDIKKLLTNPNSLKAYNKQMKIAKKPIHTIDKKWITESLSKETSFVKYLETKFTKEQINEIQRLYFLGELDYCDGKEKDVIFWQVDNELRLRTGKGMKYNKITGKRVHAKDGIIWVHKVKVVKEELPEDWKLTQCLFGEHLLSLFPPKPICLVESEKTAIIASIYFPQYIWLATGGSTQFKLQTCQALKGKTIELFPDLGKFEDWTKKAIEIEKEIGCKFHLNSYLEENANKDQRENGCDIVDLLLMPGANKLEIFKKENIKTA